MPNEILKKDKFPFAKIVENNNLINSIKNFFHSLFSDFSLIKHIISIIIYVLMFFIAKYRIDIGFNQAVDYDAAMIPLYDSQFFLTGALDLIKLNDSPLALIKNRGYIFVLILSHYLKIPPNALSGILFVIAALVVFLLVYSITKSKIVSFIFYTLILYHPIAFFQNVLLQLYRDDVFVQFTIIYLGSLFLLFYRIIKKESYILNFIIAFFCSISFVISYFLTETGILHFLIISFFTLLFLIYIIIVQRKNKQIKILFGILPLILSTLFLFSYKYLNYRTFGVFEYNMRTDGEVGNFVRNVQSIESDIQDKHLWCTIDQLDNAYNASYTFQNNKELYNYLKKSQFGKEDKVGWKGDFFGWGLTNAMRDLKINFAEMHNILKDINKDLDEAFKYGTLTKTKKISLGKNLGFLDRDDFELCKDITKSVATSMLSLKFYDSQICKFGKSIDTTNVFIEFFNIDNEKEFIDYKDFILETIPIYGNFQEKMIYALFAIWIAIIVLNIINLIKWLFNKNKKFSIKNIVSNYNVYSVLSIGFLFMTFLYIFSLSNFFIWFYEYDEEYMSQFNFANLGYSYGGIAYAFLFLSFIFGISSITVAIRQIFLRISENKILSNVKTVFTFAFYSLLIIFALNIFYINFSNNEDNKLINSIRYNLDAKKKIENKRNEKLNNINKLFSSNEIKKLDLDIIKENVKSNKNVIDNIVIFGDESKDYLSDYMKHSFKKAIVTYGNKNKTIIDNIDIYEKETNKIDESIIVYVGGFNDYIDNIDLSLFKENIEKICEIAYDTNKILILPSYMKGKSVSFATSNENSINDYDLILKTFVKYYNNVLYVDCNDLNTLDYIGDDNMHFNEKYYKKLTERMLNKISKTLYFFD